MSIKVYSVSGAPRPWRVLAGLAFKGLEYELRLLQASTGEHKAAPFLKLNPRGTVPVVEADGLVLWDSIGILAWLDRWRPEKPLFGATPHDAGEIWQIVLEAADYLRPAHNDVFFSILVRGEPVPDASTEAGVVLRAAAERLREECGRLEAMLSEGDFLHGHGPTAADAVVFPEIRLIQRAIDTKPADVAALGLETFWRDFPNLQVWKDRVEALPGMDKSIPPHWSL